MKCINTIKSNYLDIMYVSAPILGESLHSKKPFHNANCNAISGLAFISLNGETLWFYLNCNPVVDWMSGFCVSSLGCQGFVCCFCDCGISIVILIGFYYCNHLDA